MCKGYLLNFFIIVFIFDCARSCCYVAFLYLWCMGFSLQWLPFCRAQAPGRMSPVAVVPGSTAQAQLLWCAGLAALQHVGASRTRDRTHVFWHWQADFSPLSHQGSPSLPFLIIQYFFFPRGFIQRSL